MIFSSQRSSEEIYARVREKKRAMDGLPAETPLPEDPLFDELGRTTGSLAELLSGIEGNRNVHDFPLDSPLPLVGGLVKGGKRAVRRLLRFYLARQTGFNQYALEFLRVLAEQEIRLSTWAREHEARAARAEDRASALESALFDAQARSALLEAQLREVTEAQGAAERRQARVDEWIASNEGRWTAMHERLEIQERSLGRIGGRLDRVVGLMDHPLDQLLIARATGPVPEPPPLTSGRRWLPPISFAPPEGRTARYRKLLVHFSSCRRVIDLGCGPAELLELLREAGIDSLGVDLDGAAVAHARRRGFAAVEADALEFLAEQPPGSADGVAALHIIEHFDPEGAYALLCLARRVLAPGGVLALVTPNPESYLARMVHFWRDPEHVRPYPLPLLAALAGAAGFTVVEAGADPDTREPWLS